MSGALRKVSLTPRDEARELVRQMTEAINAHDTARLLDYYHRDAIMVSPVFGEITGHAAIAGSFDAVFAAFPDWTVEVADVLVDGDRVAFLGTALATDRNGWFGQPATGERISYRAMIILTLAQGKIARDERIYDLTNMLARLEKARIQKELKLAAEVQRALLPRSQHSTPFCEAVGDSLPCRMIGGDFFEFIDLPSGRLGIVLGDVAGKGPAAALLAAMIQGMITSVAQSEASPPLVLASLNRSLLRRRLEPRFATLVYGILSGDGQLVYSLAGHNPPMLVTREGVRRLTSGGPVLGAFGESTFDAETAYLSTGESILIFSDGLTEARNAQDQEFGEERLMSSAVRRSQQSADEMLKGVLQCVQEFCQGTTQTDDITLTVTRFLGRS